MKIGMSNENKSDYDAVIYCPDCGDPFSRIESHRAYCATCGRYYSEGEVRNRCAL